MKTEIAYENKNGYCFPLLTLPETETLPIGKYGRLYLDHLKKHRRGTYTSLLTDVNLAPYLAEINREAHEQVKSLTAHLATSVGVTEALKTTDPIAWNTQMNTAKALAEEMVLQELLR